MGDRRSPDACSLADEAAKRCLSAAQAARTPSPADVILTYPEGSAEEWHYDEAIHKSYVDAQKESSATFKERQRQAKEKHDRDVEEHEKKIAELLASAEAEERRSALELASLREELIEAQHQMHDLEEDCEQKIVAIDEEMIAERQRRAALEEEMEREKKSVLKATEDITELENREGQLMHEKRARMAENRATCRQQCNEIQQKADREIREIGRAAREEVDAIRKQMDEKKKQTQQSVDSCVKKRQNVCSQIEKEISEAVDTKVYQGLAAVEMLVIEAREESIGKIKEVQARDFECEKQLKEHIDTALASVNCSMQERDQIAVLEKTHRKQLETATDILGCSLPMNRHSLSNNRRLRNAGASAIGAP